MVTSLVVLHARGTRPSRRLTSPDTAREVAGVNNVVRVPARVRSGSRHRPLGCGTSSAVVLRTAGALVAAAVLAAVAARASAPAPTTYAALGRQALTTLLGVYYHGDGYWRDCNAADCPVGNSDW